MIDYITKNEGKEVNKKWEGLFIERDKFYSIGIDEEYSVWLRYSLNSCKERSILGMSNNGLLICRKVE